MFLKPDLDQVDVQIGLIQFQKEKFEANICDKEIKKIAEVFLKLHGCTDFVIF